MATPDMSRLLGLWRTATLPFVSTGRYRHLDPARVRRLHFVCKGNICRSAYAEHRARQWGLDATSSGVEAGLAVPADASAKRNALARGVCLDAHSTRPLSSAPIDPGDLLVAMEPWHAGAARRRVRAAGAQITLLGIWHFTGSRIIPDPYGMPDEAFQACFAQIDDSLRRLAAALRLPLVSA